MPGGHSPVEDDIDYNEHEPVYINDIKLKDTRQKTMPDIEKIRQQGF